jgi:hypothetical protein
MVFYFISTAGAPAHPKVTLYMGEDKHENEELLRWAFPEDVWFHVDDMSSAHVYLRMPEGITVETIPDAVLQECAQLVKANSIQGSKSPAVNVVYTGFENLKKTGSMDVGQVGFHDPKKVYKLENVRKKSEVLKKVERTKKEEHPDLRAMREERDGAERVKMKRLQQEQKQRAKEEEVRRKEEEEIRSYTSVMKEENMISNKVHEGVDYREAEDDFM